MRIKKAYPGHARRVMMGVWSHLRQFMYTTKFIVVVDDDVDVRDWKEVVWALTTRMDPVRDTMMVEHTHRLPRLRFTGQRPGQQDGPDATNKWPGETQREWGRTIAMDAEVTGAHGRAVHPRSASDTEMETPALRQDHHCAA